MGKKKKKKIRPLAICVFFNNDKIFVSEGHDPTKPETFYRPLGGRIEFGEYAQDTLRRELKEEIQQEITDVKFIGTLENIFILENIPMHEIVMVFDGRFADETMYRVEQHIGYEEDTKEKFDCSWKHLDFFRNRDGILYPDGLLELLENYTGSLI